MWLSCLNLCAGVGALLISRALPNPPRRSRRQRAERRPAAATAAKWLLLAVTFASGFVSLALEVLWTRVLLQATGSSIYVFVAVVAVFLIGIAGGSLVYERQKHRTPQMSTLGACLAGAASLALVPLIVSNIEGPAGLPVVVLLILPVTGLLGYAFPADGPALRRQRCPCEPRSRVRVCGQHCRMRRRHGGRRLRADPGSRRQRRRSSPCASSRWRSAAAWRQRLRPASDRCGHA